MTGTTRIPAAEITGLKGSLILAAGMRVVPVMSSSCVVGSDMKTPPSSQV